MKKFGLFVAVLLVVAAVGASIITGRLVNQKTIEATDLLAQDPRFEQVTMKLDSGLFSSSGVQQVSILTDPESPMLIIETRWQSSHFPGWVTFDGNLSLLLDDGSGELINLFEELDVAEPGYQGRAGWRKVNYTLTLEPFGLDAAFNSSGLQAEGVYYYSSGRQLINLSSDSLTFESEDPAGNTLFDLQGIRIRVDQQGTFPWSKGEMELTLDQVNFGDSENLVSISKPSWRQTLNFDADVFDLALQLDLGDITSDGMSLAKGSLALKTRNFNGQAVADLLELVGSFPDLQQMATETPEQALALVDQVLAGSPALVIERLDFSTQLFFPLEQKAWGELSFDGQNLPTPYLQQLEAGSLTLDDPIQRMRLEMNVEELYTGLMMMLGIPPDYVDPTLPHQTFLLENGELYLNGNPLQLF